MKASADCAGKGSMVLSTNGGRVVSNSEQLCDACGEYIGSSTMAWAAPLYTRDQVDDAGRVYVDPGASAEAREGARAVIDNWRSSHSFPLNTLQVNVRKVTNERDADPTVAQRIKRLPSIRHKLERLGWLALSEMQDIGGCRAVLSSVDVLDEVVDFYKSTSRMAHRLVSESPYVINPKQSGYRGVHLVYAFQSKQSPAYNGLKIEVQLRSRLMHAWATAVETVGLFTQQALKSSWGDPDWLRFFSLMGSAHALREGTPFVPGTPNEPDVLTEALREYATRLDVVNRLEAYGVALRHVEQAMVESRDRIFLLDLDVGERVLSVRGFRNASVAADQYSAVERAIEEEPGKDAVLVTVKSVHSLQRAYPNYFLDTRAFVESVHDAIGVP